MSPISSPIWGEPPKIRQEGNSLVVYDHASWFTQAHDERVTRYVHIWFWNGGNVFNIPEPPQRSRHEDVQPGENMGRLPLGPSNIGGTFHVVEFGGFDSSEWDDGHWTEWGRENSGTRIPQAPSSNSVVVQPWDTRPPDPPDPPYTAANLRDALKYLGSSIETWKRAAWYENGSPAGKRKLSRQRQYVMHRIGTLPQDADTLDTINSVLDVLEDERR